MYKVTKLSLEMFDFPEIVNGFIRLSDKFSELASVADAVHRGEKPENSELEELVLKARTHNGWFDPNEISFALKEWSKALSDESQIEEWIGKEQGLSHTMAKKVGVVMAGNIPLVGLHDALSVLFTGHYLMAKLSTDDKVLMTWVLDQILLVFPELKERVLRVERLNEADAVIATGSDNTARYFDYYFGNKPNIIRKNRTSVAVLTGDETEEQLKALGEDLFRYFGLGCRNVTKLYLPKGYNLDLIFGQLVDYHYVINNKKYGNNYDYQKAIYLMNNDKLIENGFVMFLENEKLNSAVSMVHYEYYSDQSKLAKQLNDLEGKIQCTVSLNPLYPRTVGFGEAQRPKLSQYADGVDTVSFLRSL